MIPPVKMWNKSQEKKGKKNEKKKIKENNWLGKGECFFYETFASSLNMFHFYSVLVQATRIICINLIQW